MRNLIFLIFRLLLRPWGLSHRVERQKLMVNSREEMPVRVRKGGFMANLLLRYNVSPHLLFEHMYIEEKNVENRKCSLVLLVFLCNVLMR